MNLKNLTTDVLVIGAGASGTRAAIAAADAGSSVLLLNKGPCAKSGITLTAGGGTQAPFHPEDSIEQYFLDTVNYGYLLADQNLAWALAEDSCERILDLQRYGVRFKQDEKGGFRLSKFPGHTNPRNISFNAGGIGMMAPLKRACQMHPRITMLEDFLATGLLKSDDTENKSVAGAAGVDLKTGGNVVIHAKATVIATGGCQQIWELTDCPADSTGDGLAMAFRAGAGVVDMEMVLFYPSVVIWPQAARGSFVHYEFLDPGRLDGKILDAEGNNVLPTPVPVRDKAMRIMYNAIRDGRGTEHGGLFWYVGDSPKGQEAIAKLLDTQQYRYIARQGVDPVTQKIEVAPGAHYQLGGVYIDEHCRTTLPGLFCVPEAGGNFEGANRLSGSALGGTQVFGARAGFSAHEWAVNTSCRPDKSSIQELLDGIQRKISKKGGKISQILESKQRLTAGAQQHIGVERDAAGLNIFLSGIKDIQKEVSEISVPDLGVFNQSFMDLVELESLCDCASLVAQCALKRTESRGHHFRKEYPERDDANWLKHTFAVLQDGEPKISTKEIVVTSLPLPGC
jgi:succinate dehydrogenase/fumarate reductase flavoprotein subunit